jgi:hypothetical protein
VWKKEGRTDKSGYEEACQEALALVQAGDDGGLDGWIGCSQTIRCNCFPAQDEVKSTISYDVALFNMGYNK